MKGKEGSSELSKSVPSSFLPYNELLTHCMALAKTKRRKPTSSPLIIRSLSVTPDDATALDRIAQDASDYIGWTVSGSAIVRALLRYADQQQGEWLREQLFPLIEQEIESGTVWGKKK